MTEKYMNLWIVNHHSAIPSKDGRSGRHLAFARHLKTLGWDTTLIVSSTRHPSGTQALRGHSMKQTTTEEGVLVRWMRTNAYGHNTPLRFLGMLVFAFVTLLPRSTRDLPRPDVVVGSTVHPFAAWAGWRLARRHGVPFVYEIRDVWPDVLIQLGKLNQNGLVARSISRLSRLLAKRAALVVSPLPRVDEYLRSVGASSTPFLWVSNGIESPLDLAASHETSAPANDDFTFMYLGSYNQSNMVETIIDAFAQLVDQAPDRRWRLRFVGHGPLEESLRLRATESGCSHLISVEPPVPRSQVVARAQEADCLVAMLHDYQVYSYGIGLNKLFDYMLAARPVVFATNAPNNPIKEAGAGMLVPPDDLRAFADAMGDLGDLNEEERRAMGAKGRAHVVENYSYERLATKLAEALTAVATDRSGPRSNQ